MFHIQFDIPALDRLVDYLEGKQQKEIDALVTQLSESTAGLQSSIEKEKR